MIPKTLHFIWVGDETRRPDNCIATWVRHNPDWKVKIWGNAALSETGWLNADHMQKMYARELNGVADMMRWEILYKEGGVVVDADSICLRPLDDDLLACEAFACWESEMARPGLIAAGYFGCCAGNAFVRQIMLDIHKEPSVIHEMAWKTVGPQRLTDSYRRYQYHALRILPSHYFIPEHFSGLVYQGPGPVYAHQMWASTKQGYDDLYLKRFDDSGALLPDAGPPMADASAVKVPPPCVTITRGADISPERSPLESLHQDFFVQRVQVSSDVMGHSRFDVFKKLCSGQRVLHMGCADWPITDPRTSLHLALEPHCARLDGFDIHAEALAALAPHVKGRLYSRFEELVDAYDLILVPEVMEHVANVGDFLAQLQTLNAPSYVLTVPDAYQCHQGHFDYVASTQTFVEVVHPDHNCWYTPYTLTNVIGKYTPWAIEGLWFFNRISLLVLASKPASG
jgi:mannosyltransferase OCH1-like enzyme